MIRHGVAPFLECSSKGDTRFSAFFARIKGRGNRSIEDLYQTAKVFEGGVTGLDWTKTKGKKALNMAEVTSLYARLWDEYIAENPDLRVVLQRASGLQDMFGQPGHCCQATELWRIRVAPEMTEKISDHCAELDRKAEQAMRARDDFRTQHSHYFEFCGRFNPETGVLLTPWNRSLDNESFRLSVMAAQANRVALQAEYDERQAQKTPHAPTNPSINLTQVSRQHHD